MHIYASLIVLPADPLRAKLIAETWLENAVQVTGVRNVLGFTGTYKGKRLSVMAHGMGIPSATIYTTELVQNYGVKNIFRIGSCGAATADIPIGSLYIAMGASTDSNVNRLRFGGMDYAAIADYTMMKALVDTAAEQGKKVSIGNVMTTDLFYGVKDDLMTTLTKMKVNVVEMELAGIYSACAQYGARVCGILTVSDSTCGSVLTVFVLGVLVLPHAFRILFALCAHSHPDRRGSDRR